MNAPPPRPRTPYRFSLLTPLAGSAVEAAIIGREQALFYKTLVLSGLRLNELRTLNAMIGVEPWTDTH